MKGEKGGGGSEKKKKKGQGKEQKRARNGKKMKKKDDFLFRFFRPLCNLFGVKSHNWTSNHIVISRLVHNREWNKRSFLRTQQLPKRLRCVVCKVFMKQNRGAVTNTLHR